MSDTDTFVDVVIVWIAVAVLGGVIIYAYWPPTYAAVWISENLVVLALAGIFRSFSDTDRFAAVAFVWFVLVAVCGLVIWALWPPYLALTWMVEALLALTVIGLSRTPTTEKASWIWTSDERTQRLVAKEVSESKPLMAALEAIMKRKEGLSNAELDEVVSDNSEWITLSVMRRLLSLGFVEYRVDLFGNPGRYTMTDLGRDFMQKLGKVAPVKPTGQVARPSPTPGPVASSPVVAKPETRPSQP
jgi:hypothetical protein